MEAPPLIDQTEALEAYSQIVSNFPRNGDTLIYPDHYGGEYLDGNMLYVYLVDKTDELVAHYNSLCNNSSYVTYLDADYSLNYLESLNSVADRYCNKYNVSGYGVDRKNNNFSICIAPADTSEKALSARIYAAKSEKETIALMRQEPELSSLPIVYTEEGYMEPYSTPLIGGDQIREGSIGICGSFDGQNAILMAGHTAFAATLGTNGGNITYGGTNGPIFANVLPENGGFIQYDTGLGDYAIATIADSNYVTTNKIRNTSSSNTLQINGTKYTGDTPVGTVIHKFGQAYGYAPGTITAISQTRTVSKLGSTITISGLNVFSVSLSAGDVGSGDSGGPVYLKLSAGNYLIGIISAGSIYNDQAQFAKLVYYTPIYYPEDTGFSVKTN